MRRYRNVPPFQYLQGFEAAARLGNFSAAASELGLSQSAVSHQMRLLEDRLGQKLFLRVGRHVSLTDAGRDYARTVATALEGLESGYRRLEPYRKPGSVVVYAPSEFVSRWLLPRLPRIVAECPEVYPWIATLERPIDFDEMEVSLAIIYAEAPPPTVEALCLFPDWIAPVLSPTLFGAAGITAAGINALPRLDSEHLVRWEDWSALAGVEVASSGARLDFSDRDAALSAAEMGLGIALASLPLADRAIRAGKLVAPYSQVVAPSRAWYAISTTRELADRPTATLWRWLSCQVAAEPGDARQQGMPHP